MAIVCLNSNSAGALWVICNQTGKVRSILAMLDLAENYHPPTLYYNFFWAWYAKAFLLQPLFFLLTLYFWTKTWGSTSTITGFSEKKFHFNKKNSVVFFFFFCSFSQFLWYFQFPAFLCKMYQLQFLNHMSNRVSSYLRWKWERDCSQIEARSSSNIDEWSYVLANVWFSYL